MVLSSCIYCSVAYFLTCCFHLQLIINCLCLCIGNLCHNFICWLGFQFWLTLLCCLLVIPLLLCHGILCICHFHWVWVKFMGQEHHHHLGHNPHYLCLSHHQDDQTYCSCFTLRLMVHSHNHHHIPWCFFHSWCWMLFSLSRFGHGHERSWSRNMLWVIVCRYYYWLSCQSPGY